MSWDVGPDGALIIEGTGVLRVWQSDTNEIVVVDGDCYSCGRIDVASIAEIAPMPMTNS